MHSYSLSVTLSRVNEQAIAIVNEGNLQNNYYFSMPNNCEHYQACKCSGVQENTILILCNNMCI